MKCVFQFFNVCHYTELKGNFGHGHVIDNALAPGLQNWHSYLPSNFFSCKGCWEGPYYNIGLTFVNKTLVIENLGFIFMLGSNQHTFVSDFSAINQRIGQCSSSIKADKRQNGERPTHSQCGEHVS